MSVALANTETMTRDEWLKFRNRGIGGSDVSVICGVNRQARLNQKKPGKPLIGALY